MPHDFVLIIPGRNEESPLATRFLVQREVMVYHILCAIFIYTTWSIPPFSSFLFQDISHFFGSLQHRPHSHVLVYSPAHIEKVAKITMKVTANFVQE